MLSLSCDFFAMNFVTSIFMHGNTIDDTLYRSKCLCFLGVVPKTDLTFVKMIGLSQWRAAIGLWNSCRIRPVNLNPLSTTARSPFDVESDDSHSLSRVPPNDPPIASFISTSADKFAVSDKNVAQDSSFHKRFFAAVSGDTICRVVTLMLYFLFLLLLSGDVELNPGPITAKQGNSDCLY